MVDFAIYPDKFPVGDNKDKDKTIMFNITEFKSIYSDEYIELIWNAIQKQPVFKILKNDGNFIRGGCSLINSTTNSVSSFYFKNNNTNEYFFSTSDGSAPIIKQEDGTETPDNTFDFGNATTQWNRGNLWLSSLVDENFPYYDIVINTSASNAYAVIKKVVL